MMYKEGQAILTYVSKFYGEEKVLLMMENIWKYKNFQQVFQETVGKNYKEFSRL